MENLETFIDPVIMLACLVIGYLWTTITVDGSKSRKFIPITMAILGALLSILVTRPITREVVLTGMVSGLASTGLYETFKQLIFKPRWIAQEKDDGNMADRP